LDLKLDTTTSTKAESPLTTNSVATPPDLDCQSMSTTENFQEALSMFRICTMMFQGIYTTQPVIGPRCQCTLSVVLLPHVHPVPYLSLGVGLPLPITATHLLDSHTSPNKNLQDGGLVSVELLHNSHFHHGYFQLLACQWFHVQPDFLLELGQWSCFDNGGSSKGQSSFSRLPSKEALAT
jgi:hypothetical protein